MTKKADTKESGTVALDFPIKRGDELIESVHVRKPNAGELRGVALLDLINMDTAALIKVLPRVTRPTLTEAELNKADCADLFQLGTEVVGFLVPKRAKDATEG